MDQPDDAPVVTQAVADAARRTAEASDKIRRAEALLAEAEVILQTSAEQLRRVKNGGTLQ
jgi:hypothetical protein